MEPAPAMRGKAIGNIAPSPRDSCLKSSTPRIISMAIRKIMKEPAMAKEETSIPKIPRRGLPIKRNAMKIPSETMVTLPALTFPDFDFISIMIGIEPVISIIAKRTIKAASISIKLKCITGEFAAKIRNFMNSPVGLSLQIGLTSDLPQKGTGSLQGERGVVCKYIIKPPSLLGEGGGGMRSIVLLSFHQPDYRLRHKHP
jgi:hypothetical protein